MPNPCGTGYSATTPKPGDPVLTGGGITAVPLDGGIYVKWDYPAPGASAVAHSLVFRSGSSDFNTATQVALGSVNFYWDKNVTEGQGYYYWVKLVSVNDTVGPEIGPAFAIAGKSIEQTIIDLTTEITESQLGQDLQSKIDQITDISSGLSTEEQARLFKEAVFDELFALIRVDLDAVDTLVGNEIVERITENSALVAEVSIILAKANENAAAIVQEQIVRADEISAVAGMITTLEADVADTYVSLQEFSYVSNTVDGMYGEYYVKIDANGYVAGFGLSNTGLTGESQFLVNADRFAVGKFGATEKLPFIIDGGNVYIDTALIRDATITSAKIGLLAVQTANIANGAISNAKIGTAEITTLKIDGEAVVVSEVNTGTNSTALSFNPEGGTIYATATCTVYKNGDGGGDITLSIGSEYTVQAFNIQVSDSGINGISYTMTVCATMVGGSGANYYVPVSASAGGPGVIVTDMTLSVAAFKR